ncbi:MAG: hypothetical protein ACPGXY_00610 [Alphaproteobacteria bacterium]
MMSGESLETAGLSIYHKIIPDTYVAFPGDRKHSYRNDGVTIASGISLVVLE